MYGETIKALLIDEDEDDFILTAELLSAAKVGNYKLDWARSFEEGLEVLSRKEHQVCLVDYRLGVRTGVELIRQARESLLSTPMILLTGQGDHDVDVEAMQAGATDYLIKEETSPARLERTIRYAVQINAERCRAEAELTREREYFAHIISAAPTVIVGITPEGITSFVNPAILKVAGYAADELIGHDWWHVLYPGDEYHQVESLFKDFEKSMVVDREMTLTTKSGGKQCVLWNYFKLLNEQGEIDEIIGIGNDVSERKRAAGGLALFRQILDQSHDGIFVIDASTSQLRDVNETACRQLGYERDELLRLGVVDINTEIVTVAAWEAHCQVLKATGSIVSEFTGKHKNGSTFPLELSLSYVSLNEENYVLAVARDITERARLLSTLESERTRLADIFTHAPAFIASLRGPDHIFELANAQFYDLIANKRDVIGLTAREAFPEVESQGFFQLLDNVYATGVPFVGDEMPVQFTDGAGVPGELRYINFVYQPMTDVDGAVSGIVCHGVNVTEQVLSRRRLLETENQLRQSQKLESVGMLAGGIAHDFNNLMTVIGGYSDLILRRLDKADLLAQNMEEIKKAAQRATSLTRQLLAFSRKQVLQPRVLDLNSVISNIEKMLVRVISEDMQLSTLPGPGLGLIKADPGQIEQVILNLVVNAKDAMPEGGKITVETSNIFLDQEYARVHIAVQPGWYVMLAVSDTGHGMDAETQKHIFEPFFTTKEQGKGTGLGLATVYGIVKQSGGNLWLYSELGVGTTFKIYLPLVDEVAPEPDAPNSRPASTAGSETILVAEDDEMVRRLARESLMMNGYTVLEAANGSQALSICQQHKGPIHLLLTDVVMPGMSGKHLAEAAVKLRPDTRVLYMSGYTDRAIVRHGVLDEDIAFLAKPFTPDALALKVIEVLRPT
jgi:two-component system, cell cycle sensor histidine kinase and response regulator CckA